MRDSLKERLELQVKNEEVMRTSTFFEFGQATKLAAFVFTAKGVLADKDRVKECSDILKDEAGVFSNWRGSMRPLVLAKMAMSDDPRAYIEGADDVYRKLVEGKFFHYEYQTLTAINLYEMAEPGRVDEAIARTARQYELAKKEHPILTGVDDLPLISVMVLSGLDLELLNGRAEECYELLKDLLKMHPGTRQMISHVLSLSDKPAAEKVDAFWSLYQALRTEKHDMDKNYMIAILGAFADVPIPQDQIVHEIGEVDEYLTGKKGYGMLGVGKRFRRLMAANMVLQDHLEDVAAARAGAMGEAIVQAVVEQIVMIICLTTVMTSSAAANSH